jgi:uncharacterized membrane protein YfcA
MLYFWLFLLGFAAFTISTISGGGGAMILVPAINFFVSKSEVAPLVHLGNLVGRPTRLALFWKHIRWDIVKAYLPAAMVGGFLGAWLFTNMKLEWLQILIGLFLLTSFWQFRYGKKKTTFPMQRSYFAPLGFFVCFLSSLIGATGAVLNPFYLNYGVIKEELIATKAANSFFVAMVQLATYAAFGRLSGELWGYGLAMGLGAAVGNFLGKRLLKSISNDVFRNLVLIMMLVSGLVILYQQLALYWPVWSLF